MVWYSMVGTYVVYFCGLQYTFVPLISWFLSLYLCFEVWRGGRKVFVPFAVWVWIFAALAVEVCLVVSHLDLSLGISRAVLSSIYWSRTWLSLALFPLVGCLNIRPRLIYRATCIVCLQSLFFIPLSFLASVGHLPSLIYTSPLKVISGGGKIFYDVNFYQIDPDNGQPRLMLFAPWAPALGFVANIYFILASKEPGRIWRFVGMSGAIAMVAVSVSRLGIICIPLVPALTWFLVNFTRPYVQITTGIIAFLSGILSPLVIELLQDFKEAFNGARASSNKVRDILGRIALYKWQTEAPIWGHGFIAPKGPKVAEGMPIGSHHTWFGLLYLNGLVGAIAIAIACGWSLITLLIKAQNSEVCRVGFSIFLVIIFFSFAENIETLAYIIWPGLVMMGIAFKHPLVDNLEPLNQC